MRALAVALAAFAALLAPFAPARAARAEETADPLRPIQAALDRQDQLAQQDRHDELIREAEQRARDGKPESYYLLGRALGNKALARADAARRIDPSRTAEIQAARAQVDALLDRSREAFEHSREAGVLVYAPALLGLARCSRYRGDLDGAIANLKQALAIEPEFKAATLEIAQVYVEKGLHADGEFTLYKFLETHADDADVRLLLGVLKTSRKRYEEAEREFRAVLHRDPANASARKLLAASLMYQEKLQESAEHFETVRRQTPKDDEPYRALFHVYRSLGKRDAATKVVEDLKREMPGTEPGEWAQRILEQLARDPGAFDPPAGATRDEVLRKLDSADTDVQIQGLTELRNFDWPAAPAAVFRLIGRNNAPAVRARAVSVIGALRDPRTLTVLEILLFHPQEADSDVDVRRATARALAGLPTVGAVPVLWRALDDTDTQIREAAVAGLAELTGWWFREDLAVTTPPEAWPAERAKYAAWWRDARAASIVRRDAMAELERIFAPITRGRSRLAVYALPALDDADASTWRAGYRLFRSLTRHDFGATTGDVSAEERRRVAAEARDWIATFGDREDS